MLLERLNYVSKKFDSARALCSAAGLSHSYLGTLTTRLRRNPNAGIDGLAAVQIAHAAGVSVTWLLTGEGPRDQAVPPNLAALLRVLPKDTYPDVVVRQALVMGAAREQDLSQDIWRDYLDGLRREARHLEISALATAIAAKPR